MMVKNFIQLYADDTNPANIPLWATSGIIVAQLLVLQWKCNIFLAGTLLENGTADFSLWAIGGPTLLCLYRIATHMPLMKLEACHSRFTGDTQVACRWWHATICYKWLESGLPISAYHFSASGGPAVSNVALPL